MSGNGLKAYSMEIKERCGMPKVESMKEVGKTAFIRGPESYFTRIAQCLKDTLKLAK